MTEQLDHDGVVAALQGRLREYWTVTVRSARSGAPLIAMFSGALQKAEPKDDTPPGETDFVWYVGMGELAVTSTVSARPPTCMVIGSSIDCPSRTTTFFCSTALKPCSSLRTV